MPRSVVVAKDVKKSFQHMGRTLDVLRGIDLTIEEGEMVGIVGQSGAGKSTLLHCIGTLDIITSGSLKIDDAELTELSGNKLAALRNRFIGFVFQSFNLLPRTTATDNVALPLRYAGVGLRERRARSLRRVQAPGAVSSASRLRLTAPDSVNFTALDTRLKAIWPQRVASTVRYWGVRGEIERLKPRPLSCALARQRAAQRRAKS